jgi:long-chain acyl-CoA synthetase
MTSQNNALLIGNTALSFAELRHLVEAEKSRLGKSRDWLALEAAAKPEFVARLLAALETRHPVAILSPDQKRGELQRHLLKHSPHADAALAIFTSGSHGEPKAVQLSEHNIESNTATVLGSLRFEEARIQNLFLPLDHAFGLLGRLLPALTAQVPTRLFPDFATAAKSFQQGAEGMWSGVPSHWRVLLEAAPASQNITHVVSAGADLPLDLRRKLREKFPNATIFNNYGLTEASSRVLSFHSEDRDFFNGFTGYPVGDWQLQIDASGELRVKGPQVMLGYLGDEDGLHDGWLATGDLAEERGDGLISIRGRRDEMVKIAGERIFPLEIESALREMPGIVDAAVDFVEEPMHGFRPVAYLVAKASLRREDLLQHLRSRLSAQKVPLHFYLVEGLPRLPGGKIDRLALRELRSSGKVLS